MMPIEGSLLFIPLVSFGAAALGAIVGLGGGILVIPFLSIALGIDIRIAMGAGLISGIATSCGSTLRADMGRFMNLRVAILLELFASIGAIAGATVVAFANIQALNLVFGVLMMFVAILTIRTKHASHPQHPSPDRVSRFFHLDGESPGPDGSPVAYHLRRVPAGSLIMLAAGVMSGLLGVANGALKMLAMDTCMGMPPRVSSASSNFMIGITAASGAIVYMLNGFIEPRLALLVIAGALPGSLLGSVLLPKVPLRIMQLIFVAMLGLIGIEMVVRGLGGRL